MAADSRRAELGTQLAQLGAQVDLWSREAIATSISPQAQRLAHVLEYHLGWRDEDLELLEPPAPAGKRLRPVLALLVARAASGDQAINAAARNAAVALELLHNFSLVHDDIQDHSQLRRHRPAVWSLWGTPQGINVGDALFALAQEVVLREGNALAAAMAADLNATALLLAEGQFLDIDLQHGQTPVTLAGYERMITRKTGVLFGCACRLGAMAGGASAEARVAYAAYGLELGVAFQEQDDLLGVWGDPQETGKPAAADIVERKRGLPAAMALSMSDAPAWLRAAYIGSDSDVDADRGVVARIIAHFDQLGLRQVIERRVEGRFQRALEHLATAGARDPARGYLETICEALVSRRT